MIKIQVTNNGLFCLIENYFVNFWDVKSDSMELNILKNMIERKFFNNIEDVDFYKYLNDFHSNFRQKLLNDNDFYEVCNRLEFLGWDNNNSFSVPLEDFDNSYVYVDFKISFLYAIDYKKRIIYYKE